MEQKATVFINDLTAAGARLLLGLSQDEAEGLVAGSPYVDPETLARRMPGRLKYRPHNLSVPKMDFNLASGDDLATLGLTPADVSALRDARPVFLIDQLRAIRSISPKYTGLFEQVFTAPPVTYTDKTTGEPLEFHSDAGVLLIPASEAESAGLTAVAGYEPVAQTSPHYLVLRSSTGDSAWPSQVDPTQLDAFPSFLDRHGQRRLIDPRFVNVQFAARVDSATMAAALQEAGLQVSSWYRTKGLLTARLTSYRHGGGALSRALEMLRSNDNVRMAEPAFVPQRNEAEMSPAREPKTTIDLPWNLKQIGIPEAWRSGKGSRDVTFVVIDTGVARHPAIRPAIPEQPSTVDWNFESDVEDTPDDETGHGTAVAGLLVGNGDSGIWGAAPGCSLIPLKVPLDSRLDSYARRRDALVYAAQLAATRKIIVNLSWRTDGDVALIRTAVADLARAGALIIASAGNDPTQTGQPHFPSDYPEVLAVAGMDSSGTLAPWTQLNENVDLAAPGGDGPGGAQNLTIATLDTTGSGWGSSFASPHVAGALGLLWSRRPDASAAYLKDALLSAGRELNGHWPAIRALKIASVDPPPLTGGPSTPTVQDRLEFLNRASAEEIAEQTGVIIYLARLVVSRRPFGDLTELNSLRSLGPQDLEKLVGHQSVVVSDAELSVNTATFDALILRGVLPFTARLILARRPFTSMQQVRGLLGMTTQAVAGLRL